MSNQSNVITITTNQLSCMIITTILGTEVLFFPNLIIEHSRQDAWICAILGGIYPVIIVLAANFMCKRFPEYNILKLSKKFLGKFLGSILNILFLVQFMVYSASRCAQLGDFTRLFTNYYTTQKVMLIIIVIAVAYSIYTGINVLARSSEFIFYFIIAPLVFYTALKLGNETEIRPKMINLVPLFTAYNIIYISIIALLIKLKGGKANENT